MGFLDFFKRPLNAVARSWREMGTYQAFFSRFGNDIYKSATVRSCIRPLAEFTSKASVKCSDKQLERLLNNRPNLYMNGHEFLYKIRTMYELKNNVFIYIQRDDRAKVSGMYPVPCQSYEAVEYANGLFITFWMENGTDKLTLPWEDLAVLRKDYIRSDISGEDNTAILKTLEMLNTTEEGIANAIKSTANLRGILKSTKAMLAPDAIKAQKEQFVKDYMNLSNEGGIASLDATQEFTPINMSPQTASSEQMKEFRMDVQRYFGVNDKIVTSDMTSEDIEVFYELKIEPFLVDLSTELTSKVYTGKAIAYEKNWIVYEANKLQFTSLSKKIQMFKEVVLNSGMTVNEWRLACNMAPVDGGDEMIRRLDVANVADSNDNVDDAKDQEEVKE